MIIFTYFKVFFLNLEKNLFNFFQKWKLIVFIIVIVFIYIKIFDFLYF